MTPMEIFEKFMADRQIAEGLMAECGLAATEELFSGFVSLASGHRLTQAVGSYCLAMAELIRTHTDPEEGRILILAIAMLIQHAVDRSRGVPANDTGPPDTGGLQ